MMYLDLDRSDVRRDIENVFQKHETQEMQIDAIINIVFGYLTVNVVRGLKDGQTSNVESIKKDPLLTEITMLRVFLLSNNITIKRLAKEMGYHHVYLGAILRGNRKANHALVAHAKNASKQILVNGI